MPLRHLANLRHDLARGGMTVETPASSPVLRTVVQFDGDVLTFADAVALGQHATDPAGAHDLLARHHAAIATRVSAVGGLRWIGNLLHYGAWAASAGLGVRVLLLHPVEGLIGQMALAALPAALRVVSPHVVRLLLRPAAARLAADLRQASTQQIASLQTRRAVRRSPG